MNHVIYILYNYFKVNRLKHKFQISLIAVSNANAMITD